MRKSLWYVLLAGIAAVSTVGVSTFALFSAAATPGNSQVTAGTLCLNVREGRFDTQSLQGPMFNFSGGPGTGDAAVLAGPWAPGDEQTHYLAVYNNCSLDARLETVQAQNASGTSFMDLASNMTVNVQYQGQVLASGSMSQFIGGAIPLRLPNSQNSNPSTLVVPANSALNLLFDVKLASSTPNTLQGSGLQTDFVLNADQHKNQQGLTAHYFGNTNLSGTPTTVMDPQINIPVNGGAGPFGLGGSWSARWTGNLIVPTTGTYTLTTYSDDGVRVWLDGNPVIDHWNAHAPTNDSSAPLSLTAGPHSLRVEYFECCGAPDAMTLSWNGPGVSGVIPPSAFTAQ